MKNNRFLASIMAVVGVVMILVPSLSPQFHADTTIPTIDNNRTTGSITLHKYEQTEEFSAGYTYDGKQNKKLPENIEPLENVEFSIWYLGDNIGADNYILTVDEAESYISLNNISPLVMKTDSDGIIKFDDLELGQYFIKETDYSENVFEKTPDFIVNLPTTITVDDKDSLLYDIYVYPRNQTIHGSVILNNVDEKNTKLAGAEFSLYINTTSDDSEIINGLLKEECLITNEHGQIVVENLPKGKYYFVETKAAYGYDLNTTPIEFEITSSGKIELNNDGLYERLDEEDGTKVVEFVNNHEPNIHNGIKSINNQYSGYNFDEIHEWVISPDIPADINNYIKYVVTDTINENLIFSGLDTVKVYINGEWTIDSHNNGTLLTKDKDYTISYNEKTRKLEITFIQGKFIGGKSSLKNAECLHIIFNTVFDKDKVIPGKDYSNKATLIYNNSYTGDKNKESEEPKVYTGGLSFLNYTISNNNIVGLAGAEFKLAKTLEDANNDIFLKDESGTDIVAISDSQGIVKFKGISYGNNGDTAENSNSTYYLVETKASEVNNVKYNQIKEPIEVVINATSHVVPLEENINDINSWKYSILNETGLKFYKIANNISYIFYLIGILFLIYSIIIFSKSFKKSKY